jgi:hypothetical protein
VAQEQPATRENLPQLGFVDLRLDEDPAADHSVLGIDERRNVRCHDTSIILADVPFPTRLGKA